MYTRASASDYDDFQTEGWTTKDLMPVMKKVIYLHDCSLFGHLEPSCIRACPNDAAISLKLIKGPATIANYTALTVPSKFRSETIHIQ